MHHEVWSKRAGFYYHAVLAIDEKRHCERPQSSEPSDEEVSGGGEGG